jgi:hypothetical protein
MNLFVLTKIMVSAIVIGIVTEISKRNVSIGGLITAMPITTMLALFWLYYEKKNTALLADFSQSVFAGLPMSLLFFIPTIYLFKKGYNFYFVMFVAVVFLGIGAYIQQRISR